MKLVTTIVVDNGDKFKITTDIPHNVSYEEAISRLEKMHDETNVRFQKQDGCAVFDTGNGFISLDIRHLVYIHTDIVEDE